MLGHHKLMDSALAKQYHLVCKHCQVWRGCLDIISCRNKHIILYFHFHKSEQFWNISAFYCGQKESQNWYEVNTLGHLTFAPALTRSGMWLLRGPRIVRARVWCYQHGQILLPFVQPPLYSECSIIKITDIGIELCRYSVVFSVSSLVSRQMQSSRIQNRQCSLGQCPSISQSHMCYVCQIAR